MSATSDERRTLLRQRSFLQGRLYFNNRRSSLDCLVRDISSQGAKNPGALRLRPIKRAGRR